MYKNTRRKGIKKPKVSLRVMNTKDAKKRECV